MPEAYTHIRIARLALEVHHAVAPNQNVYEMGANGPDPFFAYQILSGKKTYPLPALGTRMHEVQCGAFLCALARSAATLTQCSYVLGFLTHNAADAAMHPYVAASERAGGPFAMPMGHGFCEVALDTYFRTQDGKSAAVPAQEAAPHLTPDELAEVCALLHACLLEVYGADVPHEVLADSFHHFRALHRFFCSPHGGKRVLACVSDHMVFRKPGFALSHMTPGKQPAAGFLQTWENPYTGAVCNQGPQALCEAAAEVAAQRIDAVIDYWRGALTFEQLAQRVGNDSYVTGLEALAQAQAEQGTADAADTCKTPDGSEPQDAQRTAHIQDVPEIQNAQDAPAISNAPVNMPLP